MTLKKKKGKFSSRGKRHTGFPQLSCLLWPQESTHQGLPNWEFKNRFRASPAREELWSVTMLCLESFTRLQRNNIHTRYSVGIFRTVPPASKEMEDKVPPCSHQHHKKSHMPWLCLSINAVLLNPVLFQWLLLSLLAFSADWASDTLLQRTTD